MNKLFTHIKNMARTTFIIVLAVSMECYSHCNILINNKYKNDVRSLRLYFSFPNLTQEGSIIIHRDSVMLYYYKDFILYKIPFIKYFSKTTFNKNFEVVNEEFVKKEVSFNYYIYKKGDSSGLKYDSINSITGIKFMIDSFLSKRWITNYNNFYENTKSSDSLIEKIIDDKDKIVIEKLIPKIKWDASYNDSTILYFSNNIKGIDFSFSKELDNTRRMKLFKIRLVYNPNPQSSDPYGRLKKEFSFEIKEITDGVSQDVLDIFKKFKKEYSKL